MTNVIVIIEGLGVLLVLVSAYAAVQALAKARGVEASVGLLTTANDGLRQANADRVAQSQTDREGFAQQLHEQELECTKQIAELRGQITVLTGSLARDIVSAVLAALPTRFKGDI